MAAPAFIASAALSAGGSLMSSSSARQAAAQAKKIGEYNALVAEEEAQATRESSRFTQLRALQEGQRAMGTLRTRMAASGARLDVGAPLRAVAELAQEIDIDQLLIGYEGEKAARRYENQAKVNRMGGNLEAKQLQAQSTANLFRAGSTILGGISDYQLQFG